MTDDVLGIVTPIRLEYTFVAGHAQSRFLRALLDRRIVGQRCPSCRSVYAPPRGSCPRCGIATDEEVEVGPRGRVTMFCIVNLPFAGQQIQPPYACASIQLDGADISLFHLLQEVEAGDVHAGMRVEPVWVDDRELQPSMESIRYFRPVVDGRNGR